MGLIAPAVGQRLVDSKRAQFSGTGRRMAVRLLAGHRAEDLLDEPLRSAGPLTTYQERLAGKKVVSMKRSANDGSFKPWAEDLTFEHLRQGLTRPPRSERRAETLDLINTRHAA